MDRGYVHLYTGNGKGKTTAAIGLAVRALCSGKKVYIGQFIKGIEYNETKLQDSLDNIVFEQYGRDCFIDREPSHEDLARAELGMKKVEQILREGDYDLVILDEITIALYYGLVDLDRLKDIIGSRRENIELVMTGRYGPEELMEICDLVTDMREVKHYYQKGVLSRDGIDK